LHFLSGKATSFCLLLKVTKTAHYEASYNTLFIGGVKICGGSFSMRFEFFRKTRTQQPRGGNFKAHI
jgi:hypothetical protein